MTAARLIMAGRVQGVGYRDWLVSIAAELGLRGWVRNTGRDQVEALLAGTPEAVEAGIAACWHGPGFARVSSVTRYPAEPPDFAGFERWPSVPGPDGAG